MPKQLKIILYPDQSLRQKSEPIDAADISRPEFQALLADMAETMTKKDGAGLAAPQIGRNIRVIVINHDDRIFYMINPEITKRSWAREVEDEGCLSVLNDEGEIIYAPVERYKKISCIYFDEKGDKQKLAAEKMLARIIQHETDHLDGILFIDKIVGRKK